MVPAMRLGFLPLLLLLAGNQRLAAEMPAQSPPAQSPAVPAGSQQTTTSTTELPSDLARIRERAMTQKNFTLFDKDAMRIYVETVAPFPKFMDIVGDFNLRTGGVPGAGVTHKEFVESTRPKEMYSSAGFSIDQMARLAAFTYAEGKVFELLRKGALAWRKAKTDADRRAIQLQIERELAALKSGAIK